MPALMYNSGRIASLIHAATPGMKLPMKSPQSSAMMKPDSLVRFSDHPILKAPRVFGVCRDVRPTAEEPAEIAEPNTTPKPCTNFLTSTPTFFAPTPRMTNMNRRLRPEMQQREGRRNSWRLRLKPWLG